MKRVSFLLMAGLMALGFGACSDEVDVSKDNETDAQKVHMSFKLELPSSRSATDTGGETNSDATPDSEVGKDYENAVSDVVVVLASQTTATPPTYTYITHSANGTVTGASTDYTVAFEANQLTGDGVAGSNVAVFVFCNMKASLTDEETIKGIFNGTKEVTDIENIAKEYNFWMSNATITTSTLPSADDMLKKHNTAANAFFLGDVEVERSAARFDYRPGGEADANGNPTNVYTLEGDAANPTVQVELTEIALVNWSKNFHYLRRVAANTAENQYNSSAIEICGVETPASYVVDTDASEKLNVDLQTSRNRFHNFVMSAEGDGEGGDAPTNAKVSWENVWNAVADDDYTADLSTFTSNGSAAEDSWTPSGSEVKDGYKIWRYATENTLPSVASQVVGQSTGVVFRGKLIDKKTGFENRLDGTNKVYVHGNILYGNWDQVKSKVETITSGTTDAALLSLKSAYETVLAKLSDKNVEPELDEAVPEFTVYEPDPTDKNYYMYYYYKNRHNDNGNPTEMGVMEYAVVRNNVYKLTVTDINKFGHPGDPAGDPDPVDPGEPDEQKEVYFKVGVKVLPWVVRVNNIEF